MRKLVKTGRVAALFFILAVVLVIYVAKIYQLQILEGGKPSDDIISTITTTETISASRGDILDRNGELMVSSDVSYYVTLQRSALIDRPDMNDILLELAYTAAEYGIPYTDTFPVTSGAPFEFLSNQSYMQSYALSEYFDYFGLDDDMTASEFIVWIKDHYGIDYTVPIDEARVIIGIRYELEIRVIVGMDKYIFADNVSTDFISVLEERGFPGISIGLHTSRVYNTKSAPHILGYLGKMNEEEYEYYKEFGYPMDADVGKDGIEKAFEEYLHGTDGLQKVTRSEETGAIINVEVIRQPKGGNNIYTTIDLGVQRAAEEALKNKIIALNEGRETEEMVTGGAVVVEDVKTGGLLAVVSYPTFDLSTFFDDYTALINDETNPLFNRAVWGTYNPGSTFKMITGYAGLAVGNITKDTLINDTGIYMEYAEHYFFPRCWIYSSTGGGHGPLNIVDALRYSCNYFFYQIGDEIGIDAIELAAKQFGFGQSTGIEIGDEEGIVASNEYKEEVLGESWYAADNILAAIGQGYNMFTPLQMANYAATIANGGVRHSLTLLRSIKSADYTETIYNNPPEVAYEFTQLGKSYIEILQEGMEAVSHFGGSAYSIFGYYHVDVACKTGTVQSDSTGPNNGVFVCYAPADDPEIAISIVVEKGTAGSVIMTIAKDIFDYYFSDRVEYSTVAAENALVR